MAEITPVHQTSKGISASNYQAIGSVAGQVGSALKSYSMADLERL